MIDAVWLRYAGLRPTLVGVVPYAGLNFTIYEGLKEIVLEQATAAATSSKFLKSSMLVSDGKTAVFVNLCCGALSGLIAQSATYPLHVLRRRQQASITRAPQKMRSIVSFN